MKFSNNRLLSGLLIGVLATIGTLVVHAHEGHPNGDGAQASNRLSITGSPEELSQQARGLGEHICVTIGEEGECPVTPISTKAANELEAMQVSYANGLAQLHKTLTTANFDRVEYARIQSAQAKTIQMSALRYMTFLADTSAALTPEQRQMFSRTGP